eukprot:1016183-Amphidinium_carterae.3
MAMTAFLASTAHDRAHALLFCTCYIVWLHVVTSHRAISAVCLIPTRPWRAWDISHSATFVTRPIYRRLHGLYRVWVSVSRPMSLLSS